MAQFSSIDTLYDAWRRAAAYADDVSARGWMEGRDDVSPFWQEYLDVRRPYPSFPDALVLRRGSTWPLAERGADVANRKAEQRWAEAAWSVVSRELTPGFLDRIRESSVGAPVTFEFAGRQFSAGFLTNALTAERVVHWVTARQLDRPLRILEIGAGYGQVAHQLHQLLPVELYAICDLPENLFLGSYFLQANLPDAAVTFVSPDSDIPVSGLAFAIPPFLSQLGGDFDVILNTYSFQEMTKRSVDEYFTHAHGALAPDGFFLSLNSHGKTGTGIHRPSDYPIGQLDLLGLTPVRRFPFQATATAPYELVLGRGNGASADYPSRLLDAVGQALQLGLHDEVEAVAARVPGDRSTEADRLWADATVRLFDSEHVDAKRLAASDAVAAGAATTAATFLAGALDFALGDLDEAVPRLEATRLQMSGSYAHALTLLMLASADHRAGRAADARETLAEAVTLAPYLEDEFTTFATHPRRLAVHIGSTLGLPDRLLPRRLPRPFANMATRRQRSL